MKARQPVREYDASLDARKRLTLRGAEFENYHVIQYEDGSYRLEPRILVEPHTLSRRTLQMMDRAIEHFDRGEVSEPIDPEDLVRPGR